MINQDSIIRAVAMHSLPSMMQEMLEWELRMTCDRTLRSVNTRPSNESLQIHKMAMIDFLLVHGCHADTVAK